MTATIDAPAAEEAPAKKGKGKLLGIGILLVALLAGGAWFFVLKPADPNAAPKPGAVLTLDAIQINLAGGHYLRLGMALQLTDKAKEADGSKALDAAITVFSGLPVGEVDKPDIREALRKQLLDKLKERYEHEVMDVYFTEYVTQ